jgi:hypothetical protein
VKVVPCTYVPNTAVSAGVTVAKLGTEHTGWSHKNRNFIEGIDLTKHGEAFRKI